MVYDVSCIQLQASVLVNVYVDSILFSYEHYAISVRTSTIIPIEECRLARSYKNDPHHWKHLCIEGRLQ